MSMPDAAMVQNGSRLGQVFNRCAGKLMVSMVAMP
jgi:hypothetical protein